MLRFYFILFLLFFITAIGNTSFLNASTCVPSGTSADITVSNCEWDSSNGSPEKLTTTATGAINFQLRFVTGEIGEIEAKETDTTHKVDFFNSNLSVGRMYVEKGGTLFLQNKSKISFTGEGLKTQDVRITDSELTITGATSNSKIDLLDVDNKSSVFVKDGAKLEIGGGKGIAGRLTVEDAEVLFNYDEEPNQDGKDVFFEIKDMAISGDKSKITKQGKGTVVFTKSVFPTDFQIEVNEGVLDVGDIGNRSNLPEDNFLITGGQLKFSSGNFKSKIQGDGELYLANKDGDATIEVNSSLTNGIADNPDTPVNESLCSNNVTSNCVNNSTGKVIAEGKQLNIKNTFINELDVKSGGVSFNASDGFSHVNKLKIEGGSVSSGTSNSKATFSEIEILKNGVFNYGSNKFYENPDDKTTYILKSLKVSDGGVFVFQSYKDLVLDGDKIDVIDFSDGGILRIGQGSTSTLTLKNIDKQIAILDLSTNKPNSALVIEEGVIIGKLELNIFDSTYKLDVSGSDIHQIDLKRYGIINIKDQATIDNFVNSSPFNPTINIEDGATVKHLALNTSGNVKIASKANVDLIDLNGREIVEIKGATIGQINVTSTNKKSVLKMEGGEIGTFKLNTLIDFDLKGTKIKNYEIAVDKETFEFTQDHVENLVLKGKESKVTLGDGNKLPDGLNKITLDYGTLIYHYEKDKRLESLLTTEDHIPEPPEEECDPDKDDDCEEEEKEIVYDSEFIIKAGDSTLTVGSIKLENLVVESGNIIVENDMEILRKLTLGINASNKADTLSSTSKIYSHGAVKLTGLLEVEFNSTYDALLGKDNQFSLITAEKGITTAGAEEGEDLEFKFLTNLADWFTVDDYISDDKTSYVVNIKRNKTYGQVLSEHGKTGGMLEVSSILDGMITGETPMPEHMKLIVSGLDTKSRNASGLVDNLMTLMPVSNRVYANSMHANTNKIVDNLSLELRDFTNLENNAWVKIQYNMAALKDNEDVTGYSEDSNIIQAGYTNIINSKLILGGSLSYAGGNLNGTNSNYKEGFTTFNLSLGADYLLSSEYYVKGILSYSNTRFDNTRNLNFISSQSKSDLGAQEAMGHLELGYVTVLPEKYRDFNANYSVFYSASSISIDSYTEEGIGKLNVDGASVMVNDLGVGATFDKELIYDRDDVSLKPSVSFATGFRMYTGADTSFKFQEVESNTLKTTNGSYLPIFFKTRVGIDYLTEWSNISVGYRYETDVTKYNDSSLYVSFKHSF